MRKERGDDAELESDLCLVVSCLAADCLAAGLFGCRLFGCSLLSQTHAVNVQTFKSLHLLLSRIDFAGCVTAKSIFFSLSYIYPGSYLSALRVVYPVPICRLCVLCNSKVDLSSLVISWTFSCELCTLCNGKAGANYSDFLDSSTAGPNFFAGFVTENLALLAFTSPDHFPIHYRWTS